MAESAGQRRNRFAAASHGFLGQDGRAPADIGADARAQRLAYPNVRWIDALANGALTLPGGRRHRDRGPAGDQHPAFAPGQPSGMTLQTG